MKRVLVYAWIQHNAFEADVWFAERRYEIMAADVEAQHNELDRLKELLQTTQHYLNELFELVGECNATLLSHNGAFFSLAYQYALISCLEFNSAHVDCDHGQVKDTFGVGRPEIDI
jgi:hypothetical protein